MTCRELLQLQDKSLKVQLRLEKQINGECIGSISMIKYTNLPINQKLVHTITASGCIFTLSYCFETRVPKPKTLMKIAAENGYIEVLKHLHQNGLLFARRLNQHSLKSLSSFMNFAGKALSKYSASN